MTRSRVSVSVYPTYPMASNFAISLSVGAVGSTNVVSPRNCLEVSGRGRRLLVSALFGRVLMATWTATGDHDLCALPYNQAIVAAPRCTPAWLRPVVPAFPGTRQCRCEPLRPVRMSLLLRIPEGFQFPLFILRERIRGDRECNP